MKRKVQRIISFWAAVMMIFNVVIPTGAFADDASAVYQNGLPVDFSDGALRPETILGPGVEYGVIADRYEQTGHTETNFAVKEFKHNESQSIEIVGSGDAAMPFYIGDLVDGTKFWNGQATNVVFDIFINKNQADHGKPHEKKHIMYSNDYPKTNVYPREKSEINSYVESLKNYAKSSSTALYNKQATTRPDGTKKIIDLTTQGYAKDATIYVDCSNLKNVMNKDGWEIIKYEGQTVVFNIPETGDYEVKKFKVTVKDNNGNIVVNQLESSTKEKDGDVNHNKAVDKYILNHIVFNANKLTGTFTIDTAAGMFLVPNGTVKQTNGAGAGWIVAKKFTSSAEWHFYFHDRHYQAYAEKGINISKTFTNQDGSAVSSSDANKTFNFRMDEVDGSTFQVKNSDKTYHKTASGKAGDKIEFPSFGIHNTDFNCDNNGAIIGNNQRIERYYVIEEVNGDDSTIKYDSKKIYVKLQAHGHDKDKIDIKIWTSEDHAQWGNEVGEHGNAGTFNNKKKQFTDLEVEKKWQKAVYNGEKITYTDTTGSHTADSVEVKLIAVKSLLKQGGQVDNPPVDNPPVDNPPVDNPPVDNPPADNPTDTPTPKNCTITFSPKQNIRKENITLRQGKKYTITVKLSNAGAPFSIKESRKTLLSKNQTNESGDKYLTFDYTVPNSNAVTWNIDDTWWAIAEISASLKNSLYDRGVRFIAANGVSDVSFTPATVIGSVQNGLKSVSEITGGKDYTVVDTQTLSKSNNWKYKWENLPKHLYEADGSIYSLTYYIVETSAIGAASNSYSGNGTGKVTITNTEAETSATVIKEWADSGNQDGIRPASLTVDLTNGTTVVDTVTLNAENNWTATVEHLPKYNNGQLITYTWSEKNLPSGYTLNNTSANGTITTLSNTHTTAKVKVSVEKTWNDKDNQDGIRPSSVSVQLKADGVDVGSTVTLDATNSWKYEWTGLDKNKNGQPIVYSVDETAVPSGYTKNVTFTQDTQGNYSYTISNTHETEKVKISVEKIWDDKDNQDGKRADSVSVQLKADGADVGAPVTLDASNNWKTEWTGLAKNKNNGTPIIYSVDETNVPTGYEKKVAFTQDEQGNYSYTITNSHETEKIKVSVEKIWDDGENQDALQPESVSVQLKADGVNVGAAITLNNGNSWKYAWTGLDKYKDGKQIYYSVDEVIVPDGYTKSITFDKDDAGNYGYTVKNSHETDKIDISVEKIWEDNGDQDGIRPDELSVQLQAGGEEQKISCDGLFVAIGLIPENDAFKGLVDLDERGYFDSEENCLTKAKGIFVAGDCRKKSLRQLTTAVADGANAAIAACRYINELS